MSHYVTQATLDQPRVFVLTDLPIWEEPVKLLFQGAKFTPTFFTWNIKRQTGELSVDGLSAFAGDPPFAIVWIDSLVGERVSERITRLKKGIQILSKLKTKVIYVQFESLVSPMTNVLYDHQRCNASAAKAVLSVCKHACVLTFNHVIIPSFPGVSLVNMAIFEAVLQKKRVGKGNFEPLWYEDCLDQIMRSLFTFKEGEFTFKGQYMIAAGVYAQLVSEKLKLNQITPPKEQLLLPQFSEAESIPSRPISMIVDSYTQLHQIRVLFEKKEEKIKSQAVKTTGKRKHLIRKKVGKRARRALLGLTIVIATLYALLWGVVWVGNHEEVRQIKKLASNPAQNIALAQDESFKAQLRVITKLYMIVSYPLRGVGFGERIQVYKQTQELLLDLLTGLSRLSTAKALAFHAYSDVVQNTSGNSSSLQLAVNSFSSGVNTIITTSQRLESQDFEFSQDLGGVETKVLLSDSLLQEKKTFLNLKPFITILPEMISGTQKQTYAVILQDSRELWGTGGKIEAVALVVFDQGKLLDIQVHAPSELDSQLNGIVPPPQELKQYLAKNTWTLSDANWDSDFTLVSSKIAWFLGKETNSDIHGVVALNTQSLLALLNITGPVQIPGANQSISSINLDYMLSNEKDEPSRQRFFQQLFSALLSALRELPQSKLSDVWSSVTTLAQSSQILLSSANDQEERVFSQIGWSGALISPQCPSAFDQGACRVETFFETENSIGTTRVNQYVHHQTTHTIRVSSDHLIHEHVLNLLNSSPTSGWPLGTYQAMVAFTISDSAMVSEVDVNGRVLSPSEFTLTTTGQRLRVTLPVSVLPQQQLSVRLVYTTSGIPTSNSSLVFFEQKQSGTDSDPFTLIVQYPGDVVVKRIAPTASVSNSSLTFLTNLDQTKAFAIGF